MPIESVIIGVITFACAVFVLTIIVIEIKEAYRRFRKRKSPTVVRGLH